MITGIVVLIVACYVWTVELRLAALHDRVHKLERSLLRTITALERLIG